MDDNVKSAIFVICVCFVIAIIGRPIYQASIADHEKYQCEVKP